MNTVYIISGPTASGKTEYAVKLARRLGSASRRKVGIKGEIISADSRQIYKGMAVGTGAPTLNNKFYRGVRHYLIGTVEPNKTYTVYDFQKDARRLIEQIQKKGKAPIIVGGTGLWIRALKDGLDFQQTKPNVKVRKQLEKELKAKGLKYLAMRLKALRPASTPVSTRSIRGGQRGERAQGDNSHFDFNNPRHVIRALEIVLQKQKGSYSQNMRSHKMRIEQNVETTYTFKTIYLSPSKEVLNKRINKRVDEMVKRGLVKEVKTLLKKYKLVRGRLPRSARNDNTKIFKINQSKLIKYPALTGIGYQEIIDYLQGKTTLVEAVELIKLHTKQYAKRQITWFKKYR